MYCDFVHCSLHYKFLLYFWVYLFSRSNCTAVAETCMSIVRNNAPGKENETAAMAGVLR